MVATELITVIIASDIPAATKPYSSVVVPDLPRTDARMRLIWASQTVQLLRSILMRLITGFADCDGLHLATSLGTGTPVSRSTHAEFAILSQDRFLVAR
jgi:hypothetical protein